MSSHVGWGVTFLCFSSFQACYEGGKEVIVVPKTSASSDSPWMGLAKYAWSGFVTVTLRLILQLHQSSRFSKTFCLLRYVIECPNCGVIYRSRQYWYGNQDPVDTVVRTEIKHVWPGVKTRRLNSFISRLYVWSWQLLTTLFALAVRRLPKGQQQRGAASSGWSKPRGPVCVGAQRQACQGCHILADGPDRPSLLETQLPHLGEWHTRPRPLATHLQQPSQHFPDHRHVYRLAPHSSCLQVTR